MMYQERIKLGEQIHAATGLPKVECMLAARQLLANKPGYEVYGSSFQEYPCGLGCCGVEYYYLEGPKGEYLF